MGAPMTARKDGPPVSSDEPASEAARWAARLRKDSADMLAVRVDGIDFPSAAR